MKISIQDDAGKELAMILVTDAAPLDNTADARALATAVGNGRAVLAARNDTPDLTRDARYLARRVAELIGVDASDEILEEATSFIISDLKRS